MRDTENQAGKILPWDTEQFNRVVNEHVKKVVPEAFPIAPGAESVPRNVPIPEGQTIAEGVKTAAGVVGETARTAWNQISNPNIPFGEETLLRGGLGPVVPLEPSGGGGGGPAVPYTGPTPWRKQTTGIELTAGGLTPEIVPTTETPGTPGIVPTTFTQEGGGPPIGMRTSYYNEGLMTPTVSNPGAGVVPTNAPVGAGGFQGFADTEMARIERDKAEYAAHRRNLEEQQLAGLGGAGQDRLKERLAAMAPYLEGVSKGRKAKIMAGIVGEHFRSEDEMRKTIIAGRQGAESTMTTAGIRAGATREAAIMRANTEAQKMGIDVAKLGLEQQKLGLQAGNIQSEIRLREASINDMLTKTGQIEPMKLALSEARNTDERTKVQREFWNQANSLAFKETLAGIKNKYQYTPDSPEAIKETQAAYQKFTSGFEAGAIRFPFRGEVYQGFQFDGTKWVKQNTE